MSRGGFDLTALKAYEQKKFKSLPSYLQHALARTSNQKLDAEVRIWIVINSPGIWDPSERAAGVKTSKVMDGLFFPDKLEKATPFNCIHMRFIDLSPAWYLRDIQTQEFYNIFLTVCLLHFWLFLAYLQVYGYQEVKHSISNFKHTLLRSIRTRMHSLEHGTVISNLRRMETKNFEKAFSLEQRNSGFHEFCLSEETKLKIPSLVMIREVRRKAEAAAAGREYIPEPHLNALHAVKSGLWRELSKDEQIEWKNSAKKANDIRLESIDR